MNNIETQYLNLLKDILENGTKKEDRTGTGTISIFGRQIRHKMSEGFPLLTTKEMYTKGIISELLWFLQGRTDLRWLLEHGNKIWVGDAYKAFMIKSGFKETELGWVGKTGGLNQDVSGWLTKEEFINRIKTDDEFSKKWGDLGPIYGKQWRNWSSYENGITLYHNGSMNEPQKTKYIRQIDQIQNLINDLKTNPDSRRLMVTAWNPSELDSMVLPPCHYGFQVYTRELEHQEKMLILMKAYLGVKNDSTNVFELFEKFNIPTRAISLMWNQRSVDTPLGLPFNIASYGLLLEIIAKMVNMVPDELIGNLGDVHIYNNQIEGVKEQLNREQFELPKININTEFWPTEGDECGIGQIDATAVLNSFYSNDFCKCLIEEDIQISNYKHQPAIKFPLSN
jgi:thymidylate synthase